MNLRLKKREIPSHLLKYFRPVGHKPKDLISIPHMVAEALREDKWYLRSDIIWHKPNCMPESVTDRPTRSHEYLFLLAKQERYFYDADAIREPHETNPPVVAENSNSSCSRSRNRQAYNGKLEDRPPDQRMLGGHPNGRNRRSVWTIPTISFPGSHFATFPPALVTPCVKAGTSERGCCRLCGRPWERVTERTMMVVRHGPKAGSYGSRTTDGLSGTMISLPSTKTLGWQPGCPCDSGPPVPCTVFDPFVGSGTTVVVATGLGRHAIGLDLSAEYAAMAQRRIERPHALPPPRDDTSARPLFDCLELS